MTVDIKLDDLNELYERIRELENALKNQIYMGHSIGYIYDNMTAYKNQVRKLGDFVRRGVKEGFIKLDNDYAIEIAKWYGPADEKFIKN